MLRPLNFLLPNARLAQHVVNELIGLGINNRNSHTCAEHQLPTGSLNPATENQIKDNAQRLENML